MWRKSGLAIDRQKFKAACETVRNIIRKAKSTYFVTKIDKCNGDQKKIFKIVDKLLGRGKQTVLPDIPNPLELAKTFNGFFLEKISKIRTTLSELEATADKLQCPPPESLLQRSSTKLDSFRMSTESEIAAIIKKASKASCLLDPVPTSLVNCLIPVLAPHITDIVNASLSSGKFPSNLKSAIVCPLIKKPSLDRDVLKNYRPVSNLSFISKVIEKVVAARLLEHMTNNCLLDPLQSAYRQGHSTETALLKVHNDIVTAIDKGSGIFLVLLDLSAAFDTVDHSILLRFMKDFIGLEGTALELMGSYLSERTQCVNIGGVFSELGKLLFGVPQGSVLGPIAFCIYTIPIGAIMKYYNINYHIYADDTQLYCSFDVNSPAEVIVKINKCLADIRSWMIKNKLKINDDKTEFLVITSPRVSLSSAVKLTIGQEDILPSAACKSLGVMYDEHAKMDVFVKKTCQSAHYHLRNIRAIRDLIPSTAAIQLVHALVTSRIDYCNSLLYGIPNYVSANLQRVQNVAARIVSQSNPQHITPLLETLHWLPVTARIRFKILLITFKCLHGQAPDYLSSLVVPYCPPRRLRSSSQCLLAVQDSRLKSYGDRSFRVAAQKEWNKLPNHIKKAPSIQRFKTLLKTFLFNEYYD